MSKVNTTKVNTKERLMQAGLTLFADKGYQKTSIANIETEAGLAPRAGAFYRHFDSKKALLIAAAKSYVSETPEEFGLERLADYGDTRAELVAIALKYEESMQRQKPYARLIEEIRLLDFGDELQEELDTNMLAGLASWVGGKSAAQNKSDEEIAALLISVIGGWLFYLTLLKQGSKVEGLRSTLLNEWATLWSAVLDATPPP